MSRTAAEILIILFLILVNGLFAMAEIAVVSARKTRLQQQAEQGNGKAQTALDLANAPNQFLATVQVGITLIGILAGAFGGTTIAERLGDALQRVEFLSPYANALAAGLVVLVLTHLTLVLGELVPKRLGLNNAESIAIRLAPSMRTLSRLASPLVRLLTLSTELVLRILGVRPRSQPPVSEEEISLLIEHGTRAGVFERAEQEMVEQVFRLSDASAKAIMTPRVDLVWIDSDASQDEIRRVVAAGGHSRYPVARGDLDDVIGLVYAKDLLAAGLNGRPLDLKAALHPALFIPESLTALETVEMLKENHTDAALVVDEYGGLEGLVTVDDILEAIVGEIPTPGTPAEPEAVQREDGSWLLDGMMPADRMRELLSTGPLPGEGSDYQTVGGLVQSCLERLPATGDRFTCAGWRFEVVDMDGRRVDKVLASPPARLPEPPPFAAED